MMDFAAVLHSHLAAAYPFISIVSHDEQESLGLIEALGLALQRPVLVWAPGPGEPGEASLRERLLLLLTELGDGVGAGAVLVWSSVMPIPTLRAQRRFGCCGCWSRRCRRRRRR